MIVTSHSGQAYQPYRKNGNGFRRGSRYNKYGCERYLSNNFDHLREVFGHKNGLKSYIQDGGRDLRVYLENKRSNENQEGHQQNKYCTNEDDGQDKNRYFR